MRFHWDKKYLYWGLTAFLVVVASVLFFFALFRINTVAKIIGTVFDILKPIIYGLAIAYLLMPVMNFFERHINRLLSAQFRKASALKLKKTSRSLAILISVVLSLFAVSGLISMVIPQLIVSITGIVEHLPAYLMNFQRWLELTLENNPHYVDIAAEIFERLSAFFEGWVETEFLPQIQQLFTGITSSILEMFTVLKNLLIGIIVSVYVMYSKDLFAAQSKKITYALLDLDQANAFLTTVRYTHKVFGGFIAGKLLDSLIIGALSFFCMSIFDMPFPLLISVIVGVTNVIPFFGPFIGAIPSAIIILLVDPMECLYFVIFILVLQQFDGNILGPRILGDSTGLSCFWVIFAILVGGGLFGFVGMVLGVPVFAVLYSGVKTLAKRSLRKKDLPVETKDYLDLDHVDQKTGEKVVLKEEE